MSNIDKIKSRIEDRLALAEKCADAACEKNLHNTLEANELLIRQYKSLLSFIDTLPEEKPSENLEKAAEEYANKHYSEWDESWDDYNGHNVEPENDKLELIDAFIAGAKWVSIYGNDIKEL